MSADYQPGGFARRHPYALASIVVHAVVLSSLYYFGSYVIEAQKMEAQVQAGVQAASHTRTEKRVQDMEKIKSLLEKSSASRAAGSGAGAGKSDDEDEVEFSATSLPKKPQELLKQAQTLSRSIDDIAREIKAEEMAKVLKIPKEKALEQLPPPPAPPPPPETAADQVPADPAKVAEEIKKLEAKARETLVQRQKELERQEQGVNVSGDSAQNGAAPPADAAQAAGAPQGPSGKGAGGGANGGGGGATGMPETGTSGGKGMAVKDKAARGAGDKTGAGGAAGSSLSAQMATFINRDIPIPASASKGYWGNGLDIFNSGVGGIPRLESSFPVTGMGNVLGAGGPLATRVYINSWYLIGPFEGKHGRDLFATPSYPPEQGVQLGAVYFGKDKRLLKWQYVHASSYPLIPADQAEDSVYYGYTELMMDEDVDLTMLIGADDDAQVWLNDRMVWAGGNVNKRWFFQEIYDTQNTYKRDYNLNEGSRRVHFKKGRNKVFFKLSNGPSRLFFSMVLTK